jgi:hypothetical protein
MNTRKHIIKLLKKKRARLLRLREQGLISHKVQQGSMIDYAQFICRFFAE